MTEERNLAPALAEIAASHPPAAGQVGIEIEFTGISVRKAAHALAHAFSGELREEDPQAVHLADSELGALSVELDVRHAHPQRGTGNPLGFLPRPLILALGHALSPFVPRELILDPLDRSKLARANDAIAVLHEAGARGDGATLFGTLGLHFNVGLDSDDPRRIAALFKAYLCREDELRRANGDSPLMRAYAPPPYPADYVARVLAPDYWPDLVTFTRDYLHSNPTRLRSLDLLPLLLHLNKGAPLPPYQGKVTPRAALHYRLPVARIGRPGWTLADDWARWLSVEQLAHEIERTGTLPPGETR